MLCGCRGFASSCCLTGLLRASLMLQVLVQATDPGMYRVHSPHFLVPCLVPLLQYTFKVSDWALKRSLAVTHWPSGATAQHSTACPARQMLD